MSNVATMWRDFLPGLKRAFAVPAAIQTRCMGESSLHSFCHQGRKIYDWDQSLTEVNLYICVPKGVKAAHLYVDLTATHLRLGLKPNPPYLQVAACPLSELLSL